MSGQNIIHRQGTDRQKDGRTDGQTQTDRQTDRQTETIYPPNFVCGEHDKGSHPSPRGDN